MKLVHIECPSSLNPLGVKGVGDGGTIPAPAVIAVAAENALVPYGVKIDRVPVTPVWLLEQIIGGAGECSAKRAAQHLVPPRSL